VLPERRVTGEKSEELGAPGNGGTNDGRAITPQDKLGPSNRKNRGDTELKMGKKEGE